jgi:hypothetical protein
VFGEDLEKEESLCSFCTSFVSAGSSVEFADIICDDRNVLKRIVTGSENWRFLRDPEYSLVEYSLVEYKETGSSESENTKMEG